jgi:hypothetical protein
MLRKLLMWMGMILLAAAAILSIRPTPVSAQCGVNPPNSSCFNCHVTQDSIYDKGEWHGIHARKDCCTNCHGGNCSAAEKERAHESMTPNPLDDIYISCHACHPEDYPERAARFAAELGITPSSRETPTPVPIRLNRPQPPDFVLPDALPSVSTPQPPIGFIHTGLLLLLSGLFLGFWLGKRLATH